MTWTTFAALTQPTLPELDGNYTILSGLAPIPCTVAGTNTLTLTSVAGAASITAYANYMQFTGVAANTNSSTVTAQFGALAALNVYKDTPAGPVVLAGNEIVQNNEITLIYDLALNSGAGGFHLQTGGSSLIGQNIVCATLKTTGNATVGTNLLIGAGVSVGSSATITGAVAVGGAAVFAGAATVAGIMTMAGSATISGPLFLGTSASAVTRMMTATGSFAFVTLGANVSSLVTIALPGTSLGDVVGVGFPSAPVTGVSYLGYIGAAGSAILRVSNLTGSDVAGFTSTVRVDARGYT